MQLQERSNTPQNPLTPPQKTTPQKTITPARILTPRQWLRSSIRSYKTATLVLVLGFVLAGSWAFFPRPWNCPTSLQLPGSTSEENLGEVLGLVRIDIDKNLKEMVSELRNELKQRESTLMEFGKHLEEKESHLSDLESKLSKVLENVTLRGEQIATGKSSLFEALSDQVNSSVSKDACSRIQDTGRVGQVEWEPDSGKYLLAVCNRGTLNSRITCLRQNMLDAALLNRTLIFPSIGLEYNYESLLDLQQPLVCFGNNTFLTLDQYSRMQTSGKGLSLEVDRFICHLHKQQDRSVCREIADRMSRLRVVFKKTEIPPLRTPGPMYKYPTKKFLKAFSYDDPVIAFGNSFGVGGRDLPFVGSMPLKVSDFCLSYLNPSPAIMQAATGFINTYLGSSFMAVHLERGSPLQRCGKSGSSGKSSSCFHPLQQIADCLFKRLQQNPETRVVFLATNGKSMEVETLSQYLSLLGKPVPIVRLPALEGSPWAEPLIGDLQKDKDVRSMVESAVCAFSSVFYGTGGSAFSEDTARLRDWWSLKTCRDGELCGGEAPDTIPSLTK